MSFIAFVVLSLYMDVVSISVVLSHDMHHRNVALMQSMECWGGLVCAAKPSCNDLVARATRIHLFDVFAFGRKNFEVAEVEGFEFFHFLNNTQ